MQQQKLVIEITNYNTCMWSITLSTMGLGPVTNPSRIPELKILENESNLNYKKLVQYNYEDLEHFEWGIEAPVLGLGIPPTLPIYVMHLT